MTELDKPANACLNPYGAGVDCKSAGCEPSAGSEPAASTEALLVELDAERDKFSQADLSKMLGLIAQLVKRGEYHEPIGSPHRDILSAVQYYGAFWHRWTGCVECPHCKADFRDHEHGPPFKRQIGHVINDRLAFWQCPDCRKTWTGSQ